MKKVFLALVFAVTSISVVGCGGDKGTTPAKASPAPTPPKTGS